MDQIEKSQKNTSQKKSHKAIRLIFFLIIIFVISSISTIVVDRSLLPRLATVKWLSKYKVFKRATEDVVVVNKTEQITVSEDATISHYSNKSAASVAEIISFKKNPDKSTLKLSDSEITTNQSKSASGLVVTADGLILTHRDGIIVDQASYRVYLANNNSYEARLIAADPYTELALLKIDNVSDLPTTSFIAPEDIRVGAKIVAMGRSGNEIQIVYKSGLISRFAADFSLAGPIASSEKLEGVYFSDFEMSQQGDESMQGATVVDYNGDVVGLVGSSRSADKRQYFIISADVLEDLIGRFIATGDTRRGTLGVYFLNLTKENAYVLGNGTDKGAMIYSASGQQGLAIISGSAADKAGLKIADVIKSVNGEEINASQNLARFVAKYKPGDELELAVTRDGKEMRIKVILQ